ncbi:MAG TPA: PqqD family protein [Burkholderiaceae bacterium]|jgi:hypothetical protein|nr:PqqD family protein [Burkholderiaceae bacterium]
MSGPPGRAHELLPTTLIGRRAFVAADVGGKHVLMSADKGVYIGLDAVGKAIWQCLETPLTIAALCELLEAAYLVSDRAAFERDVTNFIEGLRLNGLVEPLSDST